MSTKVAKMTQQWVIVGMPLLLHMMVVEPQMALVLLGHLQSCKVLLSWKEN
jgi:hypothetical protein